MFSWFVQPTDPEVTLVGKWKIHSSAGFFFFLFTQAHRRWFASLSLSVACFIYLFFSPNTGNIVALLEVRMKKDLVLCSRLPSVYWSPNYMGKKILPQQSADITKKPGEDCDDFHFPWLSSFRITQLWLCCLFLIAENTNKMGYNLGLKHFIQSKLRRI